MAADKRPKTGRPPKAEDEKYRTPARQLGRVSEEDWQTLQGAALSQGKSFTAWAVAVLLRASKRLSK